MFLMRMLITVPRGSVSLVFHSWRLIIEFLSRKITLELSLPQYQL